MMGTALTIVRDRRGRPPIGAATAQRLRRLFEVFRYGDASLRTRVGKVLAFMGFDVTAR